MKNVIFAGLMLIISELAFSVEPFSLPWMNPPPEAGSPGAVNYSSADNPNKIFVIETFFRLCGDCNNNEPNVNRLADHYKNSARVQVLDVGIDKKDRDYQLWIQKHNPNHPVLKDADQKLIGQLGTQVYPSTYIIGCQGQVAYSHEDVWTAEAEALIKSKIDALLETNCYEFSESEDSE